MSRKIVFATGNKDKMREIREILAGSDFEIYSISEAGIELDIAENGKSFEENALIKARAVRAVCGGIVLADDSGLVIDYLGGEPGIYSARYLGEDTSYDIKNADLIRRMESAGEGERGARFIAAIACINEKGEEFTVTASMEGEVAREPAGLNGFGYDPILYLPQYKKTSAEISPEEKNLISHRGKALRLMRDRLNEIYGSGL